MAYRIGDQLQQVLPAPITGKVDDVFYDPALEKFRYLITFTSNNTAQQRWFWDDEVQLAPAQGDAQ
jgi:hypothetical protein